MCSSYLHTPQTTQILQLQALEIKPPIKCHTLRYKCKGTVMREVVTIMV